MKVLDVKIGKYSFQQWIWSVVAVLFIISCMSALTIFIHSQIDQNSEFTVEYVNMARENIYDKKGNIVIKVPDLVVERILDFPISYNRLDVHGYILLDSFTGVRYMYIRSGDAIALAKYWPKELPHIQEYYDRKGIHWDKTPEEIEAWNKMMEEAVEEAEKD